MKRSNTKKQKSRRNRKTRRHRGGALDKTIQITNDQLEQLMDMHFQYVDPADDSMMIIDPAHPEWIPDRDVRTIAILVGKPVTVQEAIKLLPYSGRKNYFYLFPARNTVEVWSESRIY
jgi:hypothetical protein